MKQNPIRESVKRESEHIDRSLRNGSRCKVIDGGPAARLGRRCAHEHWGAVCELADQVLYFGRGLRDPISDR